MKDEQLSVVELCSFRVFSDWLQKLLEIDRLIEVNF